jgi:hypothetical protein
MGEIRNANEIFVGKSEEKRQHGRAECRHKEILNWNLGKNVFGCDFYSFNSG